ncbi:MAG: hypothetical protein ACREMQ_17010 [Longimicrobiales bacterium]
MTDLRDLSRLPVDQSYWDGLEARIMADLGPRVREASGAQSAWWAPLAASAWPLVGLAAAAGLATLIILPPRSTEPTSVAIWMLRPPAENPTLQAFVSAPSPPSLATLVIPPYTGERR